MRYLYLGIGIGLGALALLLAAGMVAGQTNYPASGNWTIDDNTAYSGTSITLNNGGLWITPNGNLSLDGCMLYLNFTGPDGTFGITEAPGGMLTLKNCTVTYRNAVRGSTPHYFFSVSGNLCMESCSVSEMWAHHDSIANRNVGGLELHGATATIANSTIHNNSVIGLYIENCSPFINDTFVCHNGLDGWAGGAGVMAWNSSARLARCVIFGNAWAWPEMSFDGYWNIYRRWVHIEGFGVAAGASTMTLDNCRIFGNGRLPTPSAWCTFEWFAPQWYPVQNCQFPAGAGVFMVASSCTITGCNISNNGGTGVREVGGSSTLDHCILNNNTAIFSYYNIQWRAGGSLNTDVQCSPNGCGLYSQVSATTVKDCDIHWNGKWPPGLEGYHTVGYSDGGFTFTVNYYNSTGAWEAAGVRFDGTNPDRGEAGGPLLERCNLTNNGCCGIYAYNTGMARIFSCNIARNGQYIQNFNNGNGAGIYITRNLLGRSAPDLFAEWNIRDTTIYEDHVGSNNNYWTIGIYDQGFNVRLINCTVKKHYFGCDVYRGRLTLQDSQVTGNHHTGVFLEEGSEVTSIGSTVQGNNTGIRTGYWSTVDVRNSVVSSMGSGNDPWMYYAVFFDGPSQMNILSSTLSGPGQMYLSNGVSVNCLNTTVDIQSCRLYDMTTLSLSWYVDLNVTWQNGRLLDLCDLIVNRTVDPAPFIQLKLKGGTARELVVPDRIYTGVGSNPQAPSVETLGPWRFNASRNGLFNALTKDVGKSQVLSIAIKDPTPPALEIQSPAPDTLFNISSIRFTGKASDNESGLDRVSCSLDNTTWTPVEGLANWSYSAAYTEGLKKVYFRAEDIAGNKKVVSLKFTVDLLPPVLAFETPEPGLRTAVSTVLVTLIASDGATEVANLTIAGIPCNLTEGMVELPVDLCEGLNVITAVATDLAGNIATLSIEVELDTTPPAITIVQPLNGTTVARTPLQLVGITEASATLRVNGALVMLQNGTFSVSIPLKEGENILTFSALDQLGNEATASLTVFLDTTPPALNVLRPEEGTQTSLRDVVISGTTDIDARVIINGIAVTVTNGTFQATLQLAEGANHFTITAFDPWGNSRSVNRTVGLDTTPPFLNITTPSEGAFLSVNAVTVTGYVEAGARVQVNGMAAAVTGNTYRVDISGANGKVDIFVQAWDHLNNSAATNRSVTVDTSKPTITDVQPFGTASSMKTDKDSISVTGKTEPGARVSVGGTTVLAGQDGSFTVTVPLTIGSNSLNLISTDPAGNTDSRTFSVTRTQKKEVTAEGPSLGLVGGIVAVVAAAMLVAGLLVGRRQGASSASRPPEESVVPTAGRAEPPAEKRPKTDRYVPTEPERPPKPPRRKEPPAQARAPEPQPATKAPVSQPRAPEPPKKAPPPPEEPEEEFRP